MSPCEGERCCSHVIKESPRVKIATKSIHLEPPVRQAANALFWGNLLLIDGDQWGDYRVKQSSDQVRWNFYKMKVFMARGPSMTHDLWPGAFAVAVDQSAGCSNTGVVTEAGRHLPWLRSRRHPILLKFSLSLSLSFFLSLPILQSTLAFEPSVDSWSRSDSSLQLASSYPTSLSLSVEGLLFSRTSATGVRVSRLHHFSLPVLTAVAAAAAANQSYSTVRRPSGIRVPCLCVCVCLCVCICVFPLLAIDKATRWLTLNVTLCTKCVSLSPSFSLSSLPSIYYITKPTCSLLTLLTAIA